MSELNHIEFNNVTVRYGDDIALDDLDFKVKHNSIFGVVGPANSGKTTMLKCINRTIDFISSARVEGEVTIDGLELDITWALGENFLLGLAYAYMDTDIEDAIFPDGFQEWIVMILPAGGFFTLAIWLLIFNAAKERKASS